MNLLPDLILPMLPTGSLLVLVVWATFWKGIALWRAANEKQKYWFIAILVLNTVGILELIYLFKFAGKKLTFAQMKSWVSRDK